MWERGWCAVRNSVAAGDNANTMTSVGAVVAVSYEPRKRCVWSELCGVCVMCGGSFRHDSVMPHVLRVGVAAAGVVCARWGGVLLEVGGV